MPPVTIQKAVAEPVIWHCLKDVNIGDYMFFREKVIFQIVNGAIRPRAYHIFFLPNEKTQLIKTGLFILNLLISGRQKMAGLISTLPAAFRSV